MSTDRYSSPLSERYASKEMQYIFSQDKKFSTWRRLWIALAETEMELGLSQDGKPVITQEMIDEMKVNVDNINYDVARAREAQVRHDVMSHVYAFGQQCPKAHHPPGRHQLLCGGQHRHYSHAGRAASDQEKAGQCDRGVVRLCHEVQGYAYAGVYPFSAGTAHDRGKTGDPLVQ